MSLVIYTYMYCVKYIGFRQELYDVLFLVLCLYAKYVSNTDKHVINYYSYEKYVAGFDCAIFVWHLFVTMDMVSADQFMCAVIELICIP